MAFRTIFLVPALLAWLGSGSVADTVLYDGSLNTTPNAQGWFYITDPINGGLATQSAGGGATTLSTTASSAIQAGYFTKNPITQQVLPGMPTLDRAIGYTIQFDLKVDSESHLRPDRAGFSLIALGSDGRGIELGFWTDQVWAQSDTPLFTHAEGSAFDTTRSLVRYQLAVMGDAYELFAGGQALLGGSLRNYSGFGAPYTYTNFLFLGDNTTSAAARIELAGVAVLSRAVPEPPALALASLGGLLAAGSGWRLRRAWRTR